MVPIYSNLSTDGRNGTDSNRQTSVCLPHQYLVIRTSWLSKIGNWKFVTVGSQKFTIAGTTNVPVCATLINL
jgi:hypothetical protein